MLIQNILHLIVKLKNTRHFCCMCFPFITIGCFYIAVSIICISMCICVYVCMYLAHCTCYPAAQMQVSINLSSFYIQTSCFAVAQRPRDASCLSIVSFNTSSAIFYYWLICRQTYHCKLCSVVIGVTSRFLVINTSSSPSMNNNAATSEERNHPVTVLCSSMYHT